MALSACFVAGLIKPLVANAFGVKVDGLVEREAGYTFAGLKKIVLKV